MPKNLRSHHWSKASRLRPSTLVIAQHFEPYSKIGSTHVLYNFSLSEVEIREIQKCYPYSPWPYAQEHCAKEYLGYSESKSV